MEGLTTEICYQFQNLKYVTVMCMYSVLEEYNNYNVTTRTSDSIHM